MKFTRFYLIPKSETSGNIVLCVNNLPLMLGRDAYHSFLKEHLQNGKLILLLLRIIWRRDIVIFQGVLRTFRSACGTGKLIKDIEKYKEDKLPNQKNEMLKLWEKFPWSQ